MNKTLITGANGFVRRAIFNRLMDEKADLYGGGRHSRTVDKFVKIPDLRYSTDWIDVLKEFKMKLKTTFGNRLHRAKRKKAWRNE